MASKKSDDSMQLRKWEFWEKLRRNSEYKKLCEGIEFSPIGTISQEWKALHGNQLLIAERERCIKEKFEVESILDPAREYDEFPAGTVETCGITPDSVFQIKVDGKYLTMTIDLTLPYDEIEQMIKHIVKMHCAMVRLPKTRTRSETMESYRVYDLQEAGKAPTAIIKELWPDEFKKAEGSMGSSDYAFNKKYETLAQKYKNAGDEDWDEKAHKEANRIASGSGISMLALYQRVEDKYQAAKKRIEGVAQK